MAEDTDFKALQRLRQKNQTTTAAMSAKTGTRQLARPDIGKISGRIAEALKRRLRKVETLRIAPGTAHQPVEEQLRDIDQHQAGQDLIGVEARLQEGRHGGIGRAASHAEHQHQRQYASQLSPGRGSAGSSRKLPRAMNCPSAPMFQLLER
jgi:hypothetical protein